MGIDNLRPERTHRWEVDPGIVLCGDVWGYDNGPTVFLLHGGGQTRHAWKSAGEALGRAGFRAIAYDARGHGDSSWDSESDYTPDAMIRDLMRVMEHTGADRPALVGASMGGGVSLVAIGEGWVDASGLVLVDVAHRIERSGVRRIQAFMDQRPEGFESLEEVADAIASYQPQRQRPTDLRGLAKNVRLGEDGRYRWHWDPSFRTREHDLDEREARLEAAARALRLPTLLVRGGLSDILSDEGAASFFEQCPHAEFVNVADAAHMVAGDQNDIFASAVIEFLVRAARDGASAD